MFKKIRIPSVWIFVGTVGLICAVAILVFYLQIPPREAELIKYLQAHTCQDQPACRQRQTAMVVFSETEHSSFSVPTGRMGSKRVGNTQYNFRLDLAGRQFETHVFTKTHLDKKFFDFPNVYLLEQSEMGFAEINFPQGKTIQVEVWNDRVTFLFVDTLGQVWDTNSQIFVMTPVPAPMLEPEKPGYDVGFAVPTSDHPVIALDKAQQNLSMTSLAAAIIMIFAVLLANRFKRPFWRPDNARSH